MGFSYPGNCILLVCNRTHGKPTKTCHQIDVIFSLITHLYYSVFQRVKRAGFLGFAFVVLIIYVCIVLLMSVLPTSQKAAGAPRGAPSSRCSLWTWLTSSRAEAVPLIKLRKHRKQNFLNRILCRHILGKEFSSQSPGMNRMN